MMEAERRHKEQIGVLTQVLEAIQEQKEAGKWEIPIPKRSAGTPKVAFCIQWFKDHPEDVQRSGRKLEQETLMQGRKVSYKTWNESKRMLQDSGYK